MRRLDVRLVEERPNPLLHRPESTFEVSHPTGPTPTRDAVRAELAKMTKVPKDRLVIERMQAKFGTATTVGFATGYRDAASLKKIVREHIRSRHGLVEKPAAPAEKAADAPADAAAGQGA